MDTTTFLKKILPPEGHGYYCLADFRNGLKSPPQHRYTQSIDELVVMAQKGDAEERNVFHACATYVTNESRKQSNTAFMQSIWADLDVKEGEYASQKDACLSIMEFCAAIGLPQPMLVSSGRGIHCYWPLTAPIASADWKMLADKFAAVLARTGVRVDTTRTADQASILRPVGTHHRKAEPIQVKLLKDAEPIDLAAFAGPILTKFDDLGLIPPRSNTQQKSALSSGMDQEYPPSSGAVAADKCPAMAQVRDSQGDVDFPQWRNVNGVLKHCTDGPELAEAWSAQRQQTGHDKHDWNYQWQTWTTGPTSCDYMAKSCDACSSCPMRGKVTSPVQLGVTEEAPSVPVTVAAVAEDGVSVVQQELEPDLPKGFRWDGTYMSACVKRKDEDSGEWIVEWVQFCRMLIQVGSRVRDLDGTFAIEMDFYNHEGEPPRRALVPTASLADVKAIRKMACSYEAVPLGNSGTKHMTDWLIAEIERRRAKKQYIAVRPHLGWQDVDDVPRGQLTGEFVYGTEVLAPKQAPRLVHLSKKIPEKLRDQLGLKGDINAWVKQVNHVYNRPGAEAWQFAFAVAFGAPLVRLIGGMWHGIPYVMYGDTGTAKTTTALVATSIYGPPAAFSFAQQKQPSGDTLNATIAKMGAMCNLPFVLDELSGRSPEELQALLYAFANGLPKDRCAVDGSIVDNNAYWDTLAIATTNSDLRDSIKQIESPEIQEALKHRMVQVHLKADVFEKVFYDIEPVRDIENAIVNSHQGVVGRRYIQLLVDNMDQIQGAVRKARETYKIDDNDSSAERYHRYLVFTAIFGARLAAKAGLISFDIDALERWAKDTIIYQRREIHDWDANIAKFLASLQGRILVTKGYIQKRGNGSNSAANTERILAQPSGTTPVAARLATDSREFWVDNQYLRDWCTAEAVPYPKMFASLANGDYLVYSKDNPSSIERKYLCAGTTLVGGRSSAIQLRFDMVSFDETAPDNVVPMHRSTSTSSPTNRPEADTTTKGNA